MSIHIGDRSDDMWTVDLPVVSQTAIKLCQLEGSTEELSLADGVVQHQGTSPFPFAVSLIVILAGWVETSLLAGQVDTGQPTKTTGGGVVAECIDAQFKPQLIEIDIARLLNRLDRAR